MIDELITLCTTQLLAPAGSFKTVAKAYSMTPLENLQVQTPALLFMPGKDEGGEPTAWNPVRQTVVRRIHAFVLGDVDEIHDLCNELRPVMLGYRPYSDKTYTRLELETGEPTDIKGVMWYVDTYMTRYQLTTG